MNASEASLATILIILLATGLITLLARGSRSKDYKNRVERLFANNQVVSQNHYEVNEKSARQTKIIATLVVAVILLIIIFLT